MGIFLLFFSSLHSTHCTYSRGGLIHFSCILLGLCWLWDVSLKNWRKLDSSLCIIVGAVCSLMLETTFTFPCGKKKSIFSIWLRVLMWLTSYDSCSSWSVINHESKIHPKPTLLWDFKQWWALDSPIFLLCPPGLIRSDERTAPVLSELVKMFHKVIVFSLTLFFSIYLYHNFLLGQLMAPFANEQCVLFCFVFWHTILVKQSEELQHQTSCLDYFFCWTHALLKTTEASIVELYKLLLKIQS